MTDKQIILDGMECRYWFRPNPTDYRKCSLRGQDDNCDEIKDCFIKELLGKLKAKEQECKNNKTAYQMELDIYNQECLNLQEELKETLDKLDQLKAEKQGLIKDWEEKKNLAYEIACKNEKLKQTFTEIKEIAERCGKRIPLFEIDEIAEDLKQILQKISEVLE